MNYRLFGLFRLRSPMSHIGESISTVSYLVQEPIVQPDGSVEEVFVYSGNAWRGQLRDLSAAYMLDALGGLRVPIDTFHLLFSGGRIGGDQVVDVARARQWRQVVPMLALFGGGVGNQILPGKLRIGNSYPLCREAIPTLGAQWRAEAERSSYRSLTFEKSFSRKDDAKDDRLNHHLAGPALLPKGGQQALFGEAPKVVEREGPADQMRMTVELLAAGTALATEIDLVEVSDIELGAMVAALHQFSRSPHIGGQANKGHGRVALTYELLNLDTGELLPTPEPDAPPTPFIEITDGPARLSPPAATAKTAYDTFLRDNYDRYLQTKQAEITQLLGAGA